jgi:hypothetical protein
MIKKDIGSTMKTLIALVLLALSGCSNAFLPPKDTSPAAGRGIINISLGAPARTLLPAGFTFDSYDLTFTPASGTPVT